MPALALWRNCPDSQISRVARIRNDLSNAWLPHFIHQRTRDTTAATRGFLANLFVLAHTALQRGTPNGDKGTWPPASFGRGPVSVTKLRP